MKIKEIKIEAEKLGMKISKAQVQINGKSAYRIQGQSGLFTKSYLRFLVAGY